MNATHPRHATCRRADRTRRCSSDWQSESFVRIRSRVQIPPPALFVRTPMRTKEQLEGFESGRAQSRERSERGSDRPWFTIPPPASFAASKFASSRYALEGFELRNEGAKRPKFRWFTIPPPALSATNGAWFRAKREPRIVNGGAVSNVSQSALSRHTRCRRWPASGSRCGFNRFERETANADPSGRRAGDRSQIRLVRR